MSARVVVVTGASGGIGRATAVAFAARGDRVALLARGESGLQAAADEVRRAGGVALVVPTDMADAAAVEAAAVRVEAELGEIDVWVNDAFASVFAPFDQISPDEFARVTEVSYLGYVYGTMSALRRMKSRDRGAIVQVGSALAYRGIPLQTAYCGAKHAIQGFHEALRCELLHEKSNVHVTMVQMPAVNTPQFSWVLSRLPRHPQPVPPIYQPEVAARAVVHAADHPQRREYWVGSTTAATLVANAVAPGLLDRYLGRTGFDSQQTKQPRSADAPENLWKPADGDDGHDFGAHGAFDDIAHPRSAQLWASQHHGVVGTVAAGLAAAAAGLRPAAPAVTRTQLLRGLGAGPRGGRHALAGRACDRSTRGRSRAPHGRSGGGHRARRTGPGAGFVARRAAGAAGRRGGCGHRRPARPEHAAAASCSRRGTERRPRSARARPPGGHWRPPGC